ncbi:hypothetical protein JCM19992_01890 [Thermostilla marina]
MAHWKTVLLLVAATASTSLGCCYVRPMHGLILRGDWSLEVNRVPWINQRTVNSNDAAYTCGSAVVSESAVSPTPVESEATAIVAPTAYHARRCLRCAGGVQPAVAAEPAGVAAAAEPAKFHPVPTAPVFHPERSSSGGENNASADAPASSNPEPAPPSKPEVIPTPAPMPPSQSSGWKARGNVSTAASKKPTSWVFRAVPVDPTEPTPTLARAGASVRR